MKNIKIKNIMFILILIGLFLLGYLFWNSKQSKIIEKFEEVIDNKLKRFTNINHNTYGDIYVFDEHDHISRAVLKGEIWEEPICKKMAELYKEGTDILDIGANIGLNSLRMSQIKPVSGTFHLFEPQADVFLALDYNTRNLNRKLYNFPLSDKPNILSFSQDKTNIGATQMKEGFNTHVSSQRLDALQFPNKISLVKMDVEGNEYSVLEGGRRFFEQKKPNLLIEIWDKNKDSVFQKLQSMGYTLVEHLGGADYYFKPT
jgi:FkbM family methyltransferase